MCSNGYPDQFKKNILIKHLDEIKLGTNEYCFHAGTKLIDDKFYAISGRVLNFVSLSENFSTSRIKIIDMIKSLNWNGGFYRKDIGYKVINE
jgi:phosphoribosylamine--glycine ligase